MRAKHILPFNRILLAGGIVVLLLIGALVGGQVTYNKLINDTERKVYFFDPRNHGKFSSIKLEKEPDDTFNNANVLVPGYQTQGTFSSATDVDMYTFTTNTPANIQLILQNTPAEYSLSIYDSNKVVIASSQRLGFLQSTSVLAIPDPGKYYIKLIGKGQGSDNSNYPYTILFNILPFQE